MSAQLLLWTILIPAIAALIVWLLPKKLKAVHSIIVLLVVAVNIVLAIMLFGNELSLNYSWAGYGIDFGLRLYHFSSFILLAAAGFAVLIGLYSVSFMKKHKRSRNFYALLLFTMAMANGAILANNLILLLFFWEGLMVPLYGMIMVGGRDKFPTAVKALVLNGIADLSLMLGVILTVVIAGTAAMDQITAIPTEALGAFAFVCLMLGAIGKAGSMPFHSWIPDAAVDAPLPFMAFVPAAIEKLLGIYLLVRITFDFYDFQPGTGLSTAMMIIGGLTLLFAVAMALIQKDYKRLLSYHAVSQVGYMILGIGTAIPIGIVGGLFHMINHAMYKSCLFLTAGSVEKQTGTTDLNKLGGLRKAMPITFICFLVAALSISGVPPFNGFYSKEMIFDASLQSGMIFYIIALLGAFLTAASFLKLGHAAFFGERKNKGISESSIFMGIPMLILAAGCIIFGVFNKFPLQKFIQPVLGDALNGHDFSGFLPHNWLLVGISVAVLLLAVINHIFGAKRTGKGLGAVDHIHYAPGLHQIYNLAERRVFDPYEIVVFFSNIYAWICKGIDAAINWFYDVLVVSIVKYINKGMNLINNRQHNSYVGWALSGLVIIACVFIGVVWLTN